MSASRSWSAAVSGVQILLDSWEAEKPLLHTGQNQIEQVESDDVSRLKTDDSAQARCLARCPAADRYHAGNEAVISGPTHVVAVEQEITDGNPQGEQAAGNHQQPAELQCERWSMWQQRTRSYRRIVIVRGPWPRSSVHLPHEH